MAALAQAYGAQFAISFAAILSMILTILFYTVSPVLRQMDDIVDNTLSADLSLMPEQDASKWSL